MRQLLTGVVMAAVSAVLFNLGMVWQKQGAARQRGLRHFTSAWIKGYLTSRLWWTGTLTTLLGYGLEFWAFALAPFVLIQPVYTAGMTTLAFLAVVVAQERFRPLEWVGMAIAVSGALVVVSSARPAVDAVSVEKTNLTRMLGVLVIAGGVSSLLHVVGRMARHGAEVVLGAASGVGFTGCEVITKALSIEVVHRRSGTLELWLAPKTWLMLVGLVSYALMGTYFLAVGFERGRALIVGGTMGLSADLLPMASGIAVFGERLVAGGIATWLRIVGVLLVLAGASVVVFAPATERFIWAIEGRAVAEDERAAPLPFDEEPQNRRSGALTKKAGIAATGATAEQCSTGSRSSGKLR